MSLAVLADHMASRGRGPDSMLIHMSPREVQGLQALAENHGGSLTINPETGLPEAGFLDKLLPTIIGVGISYFSGGTIDPKTAAMIVGGVETARTGDIGKGISAGLGAYGGANLGAGMTTAGSTAMAGEAATLAGTEAAAYGAAQGFSPEAIDVLRRQAIDEGALQQGMSEITGKTTTGELFSKGFDVAKNNPMAYLKANAKNLGYAFGPAILAGASAKENMPKTTTGMIAPYTFDPYSGTYTAAVPYPASPNRAAEGGLMGLANGGMAGYEDDEEGMATGGMGGMFNFAQQSEPVVRMAEGGIAGYAGGDLIREAYEKGDYATTSRLLGEAGMGAQDVVSKYGLSQADAAAVAQNLGYKGDMSGIQYAAPATTTSTPTYFTQNPDVAAAFADNSYGMDANTFAKTHFDKFGQAEGRTFGGTSTPATNTGANTDIKFGPGDDLVNTGGGGGGLPALNNAVTNPYYFQVNPDVAAEYARNPMGLTPEQFAKAHYTNFGQKEGREFEMSAGAAYAKANNMDLVGNTLKWIDTNPFATPEQITAAIKGSGMSVGDANRALDSLVASGKITEAERYFIQQGKGLSGMAESGAEWLKKNPNATQTQINAVLGAAKMDTTDAQRVLAHGFQVANDQMAAASKYIQDNPDVARWITSDQGKAYIKEHPEFDAQDIAFTHYERYGKKEGRKWGIDKKIDTKTGGTGTTTTPITYNTAGTNVPVGLESMLGLPPGVSGAGITTVNPNGTITTRPDLTLPMSQVRDDYVRGGGNLGYTPPTFASLKAVEDKYPLRGGSKQSYDFLTGKTDYDPVPYTKTGEIMKPYASSVLGIPMASAKQMYLFDPATKTYKINPDYAIPTYDKEGKKSLNLTNQDVINYVKSPEYSNDDAFVSWMTSNNLTPEQVAAATGMSIADVYKKIKKAKPVDVAAAAPVTGQNDGGGGGDGGQANGGLMSMARGGMAQQFNLGDYSDGGRLLRGPGDGVSDSIPASIGGKRPARLADGEFVVPARIVSELGNGSTEAGARKLYAMMDRIQSARRGTVGKGRVAKNSRSEKYLPA